MRRRRKGTQEPSASSSPWWRLSAPPPSPDQRLWTCCQSAAMWPDCSKNAPGLPPDCSQIAPQIAHSLFRAVRLQADLVDKSCKILWWTCSGICRRRTVHVVATGLLLCQSSTYNYCSMQGSAVGACMMWCPLILVLVRAVICLDYWFRSFNYASAIPAE